MNKKFTLKKTIRFTAFAAVILAVMAGALWLAFAGAVRERKVREQYGALVTECCFMYNADANLVYAVIWSESGFRADALSSKGAVGLMQLMPATARYAGQSAGIDFDEEALGDPDVNLRLGIWYLGYLCERFDNFATVAAAYNAGETKVRSWLEDGRYSQDGKTLEDIPYPETGAYVQKVTERLAFYREKYSY